MKKMILLLLVFALLGVEPYLSQLRIQTHLEDLKAPTPTEFVFRFLGEIRYTLAAYLWLKTEIYHHELGLTTISSQIGSENPQKVGEILSICRIVSKLDPHFIQAYDVGGWRLYKGLGKSSEAIDFLKEGVSNNPESGVLNEDLGQLYFFLKDCKNATPYLEKASELTRNQMDLGNDFRLLGHCYEMENAPQKALGAYQRLHAFIPDDSFAVRRIHELQKKTLP